MLVTRPWFPLVLCGALLLAGCPAADSPDGDTAGRPLEGVRLRLAVVDDPALAATVDRAGGEWKARSGAELSVHQVSEAELLGGDHLDADAVICSSRLLGTLAEREWIAAVPPAVIEAHRDGWMDVFELARSHEAAWAGRTMAVPLGSPVLVCYYRADLLKQLGRTPPTTWPEYHALAKLLSDRGALGAAAPPKDAPWAGAIEPLGPRWAGLALLARAAAAAKHRDNYSTLFDIQTMEPLVDGPPMVQALMFLVADARLNPPDAIRLSPEEARARIWRGQAGMAITWPTAAAALPEGAKKDLPVAIVGLPGSRDAYNVDEGRWEPRREGEPTQVPLLAVAGQLGMLGRQSEHQTAAAELLLWLSGEGLSPPPSAKSPATTLFRRSHVARPAIWTEPPLSPAAAAAYAKWTETTFQREQWLFAPRIPGSQEYLAALDEAVHRAVGGQATPAAALREAAGRWREITARLGAENQRVAYLHSLGLEP